MLIASKVSAEELNWQIQGKPLAEHFDTMAISSNPQNFRIHQDKKGYIYVANGAGILIFDGNDWQVLSKGDQQVYFSLGLGEDGRVYAGTLGDLGYFEPDEKGKWGFKSLITDKRTPKFTYIYQVLIEGEHVIYLTSSYLFHFHPDTGLTWVKQKIATSFMISDGENILTPSYTKSMLSYSLTKKTFTELEEYHIKDAPYIAGMINKREGDSTQLIYSRERLYQKTASTITHFTTEIDGWMRKNIISVVKKLSNENIVVGTRSGGLAVISKTGKFIRFYNKNYGLKDNHITDLMIDREENIWVSHASNGISRVELDSPISQFSDSENFILSTSVNEFKGKVFAGAIDGLFKLELSVDPEQPSNFKKITNRLGLVLSLLVVNDELLIGHDFGIQSLKIDKENQYQFSIIHDSTKLKGSNVRKMIISTKSTNIIYAISTNGLIKLVKKKDGWVSEGLLAELSEDLFSIHQDSKFNLWLGSVKGKFYKVSELENWPSATIETVEFPQTKQFSPAMSFNFNNTSLFSNSLIEGIYQPNFDTKTFKLSEQVDWKENNVNHFEVFNNAIDGSAWFATKDINSGRNRVGFIKAAANGKYHIDFSALDQLNLEFVNGLYTSKNGVLWINAKDRIVRFDPSYITKIKNIKAPVLTKIIELGSGKKLWSNATFDSSHPTIQLFAPENAVRVHFSAVNYQNSETLEYRYRLSRHQDEWSTWSKSSFAEFTNLKAGNFKFELQYRRNVNSISETLNLDIFHIPYWYQYFWVKLVIASLLMLSIIGFTILFSKFKNKKLTLQAIKLEKEVAARTAIISKQNIKLRKMDEAKNVFFTNVSHEFRTPLTLAIGPLKELIKSNNITNPQDQEYLDIALKNSLHMMELLSQVLDINRLESGKMPLKIVKLNLVRNLQYCIDRFHQLAKQQQVKIVTSGFNNNLDIYFDRDHFEKIILNLISNAIKYSPLNSTIKVGIVSKSENVDIWIQDKGIGIKPEDKPHIFDRFYQGHSSSHTIQPGTGIGLALVKELLSLHHGKIHLDTQEGDGTKFTITLLLGKKHYNTSSIVKHDLDKSYRKTEQANIPEEEVNSLIDSQQQTEQKYKKTLLIVDDNEDLRRFVRSILQTNYTIIEADNGRTALQSAVENQPDLILCDVMMPILDGLELSKQLRASKTTAHIPLILLTAKSSKRNIVEGLQQGADDYLSKPFDSSELIARIAAQIAQKQRIAENLYQNFNFKIESTESDIADVFFNHLVEIINSNLSNNNFDVDSMCQEMNVSRSTLFRQVKKYFDCTPRQLLKTKRLEFSLQMLKANSGSVSEVAYAVGFQSLSAFSRAFSDRYDIPPTRFDEIIPPD